MTLKFKLSLQIVDGFECYQHSLIRNCLIHKIEFKLGLFDAFLIDFDGKKFLPSFMHQHTVDYTQTHGRDHYKTEET